MTPHSAPAAEPRPDLTTPTIAGFFAAAIPLAAVLFGICLRTNGWL